MDAKFFFCVGQNRSALHRVSAVLYITDTAEKIDIKEDTHRTLQKLQDTRNQFYQTRAPSQQTPGRKERGLGVTSVSV